MCRFCSLSRSWPWPVRLAAELPVPAVRPSIVQPEIQVGLANSLFFGSTDSAPANIDVVVTNRATVPITVRRIDVDSPGMSTYTLRRVARDYREVIAPGETKRLTVFATAVTAVSRPTEPLTIRAFIDFEVGRTGGVKS